MKITNKHLSLNHRRVLSSIEYNRSASLDHWMTHDTIFLRVGDTVRLDFYIWVCTTLAGGRAMPSKCRF